MRPKKTLNLKESVIKGIFLLVFREIILRIISIGGQLILVRLLSPEYFGIYAIMLFLVSFLELFGDLGFTQAIVQNKKNLKQKQLSSILIIKLALTSISFLIFVLTIPWIKSIYSQLTDEHIVMILILSLLSVPKTFKRILFALLDRDLNFSAISKIDVVGVITYFLISILLAVNGYNLWSFVIAILLREFAELAVAWYYMRWVPSLSFSLVSIRKLLKIGSYMQAGNFIYFIERSIIPIAGYRLSAFNLGLLSWSSGVAELSEVFFSNYGRVAFSGLSKIQDNKEKVISAVNKSISLLNVAVFLFCLVVIGYSKEFVELFLSDQWILAIPALHWFIASLVFSGTILTVGHALLAMGKARELVIVAAINLTAELALASILVQKIGFMGIAYAVFNSCLMQFIGYSFLAKKFEIRIDIKKVYMQKIIFAILTSVSVTLLNFIFPESSYLTFFIKVSIATIIYVALIFIYSKDDVKEIKNIRSIINK